jgi:hypothetical protein
MTTPTRPFSRGWMMVSVFVFLAVELAIGTLIGPLILGKYLSPMFHLQVQMMMHLASLYLGGFLIGVLSPGVRLSEPALGAAAAVVTMWLVTFFLPTWFPFTFGLSRMLIGCAIAAALAYAGAFSGEKLMGNVTRE